MEVSAASTLGVNQTAASIVGQQIRVNKLMVNHILSLMSIELAILEGHYTIANEDTFQVDLL